MITTVLWDFNGTVMDDMSAAVKAVNAMSARRGLRPISEEWYTQHLETPLERFYASIGFDMERERLEEVSEEFQQECAKQSRPVFPEVRAALERFQKAGLRQLLFSSLHHDILLRQAAEREVDGYFEAIVGQQNRSLGSKEEAVARYLAAHELAPAEVLVVGDLTSDWEMAHCLGCPCVLIGKGHQHSDVLRRTGATVLQSAEELPEFLEAIK